MKSDFEIKTKPGTKTSGEVYKTCNECREIRKKPVQNTPFVAKKISSDYAIDELITCRNCKCEKNKTEFKVLKYGALTKTCLACLARCNMYQESYKKEPNFTTVD
jgi:hypothetical protein